MTEALKTVSWRGLLDELAAGLPAAGDTLVWCVGRSKYLPPLATALAVLAVMGGRKRLGYAMAKHTTEDAPRDALADWIYWTSRIALRTVESPEPAIVPGPVRQGEAWIDPRLGTLPLAHLAREFADTHPLPLVVRWAELGPITGGRCMREVVVKVVVPLGGIEETKVCLVEISPSAEDMKAAWLHELSHCIDDQWSVKPDESEAFADALAALLAQHRPANLAAVEPLIAKARLSACWPETAGIPQEPASDGKPSTLDVGLPTSVAESLYALAHLPLQIEGATP